MCTVLASQFSFSLSSSDLSLLFCFILVFPFSFPPPFPPFFSFLSLFCSPFLFSSLLLYLPSPNSLLYFSFPIPFHISLHFLSPFPLATLHLYPFSSLSLFPFLHFSFTCSFFSLLFLSCPLYLSFFSFLKKDRIIRLAGYPVHPY